MIFGGSGADSLYGGAGDDLILGDAQYSTYSTITHMPYALGYTQSWIWSEPRKGFIGPLKESDYWQGAVWRHNLALHEWEWNVTNDGKDFDITLAPSVAFMQELRMAPVSTNDDDYMDGGDGNDVLQGGSGNDILKGGLGNDHYHITPGHSTCIDIGGWDTYVIHLGSLMQGGTATIQDSDGMGDILFDGQYLNAQKVFAAEANQWHIQGNQGLGILHREGQDLHIQAQGYSGNVVVQDFFSSDVFLNLALPDICGN